MRAAGEEFSEMAELGSTYVGSGGGGGGGGGVGGRSGWGSSYGGATWGRTPQHRDAGTTGEETVARGGRSGGMYYSPPGTSYTIVERPHPHSHPHPHPPPPPPPPRSADYVRDHYGSQAKLAPRATYLGASTTGLYNNKKRPISPEQVLRMFGNNQHHHNSTTKLSSSERVDRPDRTAPPPSRRSPASSPASTTHQVSYSTRSPGGGGYPLHELSTRTVTMVRDPPEGTHGFGICVKGGKDSGVGVYISRVEEGSVAERAGLRPGDSILEVNGTPFTGISHEEALKMLKSCRKLSMTVRSPTLPGGGVGSLYGGVSGVGGGPWLVRQTCSWMDRQGRPVSPPLEYARSSCVLQAPPPPPPAPVSSRYSHARSTSKDRSIRRVDLCIEPGQSLGLMIRGGVEYNLGIFITGVDKDSVAERAGLMVGDQILEVNGQSFLDVTHDEAVSQLKYHKRMSLVVRDVGKVPHSCTAYGDVGAVLPWDSPRGGAGVGAGAGAARRWAAALQMVEEKARCLLARSEFAALCYYTDEYAARQLHVEEYVHAVLELLNTPEKYTLLTELRELIAKEDRARFDELVYNRPDPLRGGPPPASSGPGSGPGRGADPRDHDYRHARRKGGLHQLDSNHSMLMSSLHEISAPEYGDEEDFRSPSEDSGLGLAVADRPSSAHRRRPASAASTGGVGSSSGAAKLPTSDLALSNDEDHAPNQDYASGSDDGDLDGGGGRGGRRHSSPGESRSGSATDLHVQDYEDSTGYLGGLRSQLGGWTQRMKSWYWGRPLELAHKLSRSFDMKDEQGLLDGSGGGELGGGGGSGGGMRRHQSMQRLARGGSDLGGGSGSAGGSERCDGPNVALDMQGNLRVIVRKSRPILGIAIEGGANTKHPLPRIINIHENGAAYNAGGLEVGQLILQVDGQRVEGLQHQEVARLIAESFARPDRDDIEFLVVEAKKSNLEPKPTALIFLEA